MGSPNWPVCQCVSQSVQTVTHLSACTAVRSVNICAQSWPLLTACRQPRSGSLCWCQALILGNRGTTPTTTPIAPSMEEPLSSRFACKPSECPFPECADMHRVYRTDPASLACVYHKAQQRLHVQTELGVGQAVQTTAVEFVACLHPEAPMPVCMLARKCCCMHAANH